MRGRRPGDAYALFGFVSKVINGKHVAICNYCERHLQNTAHTRLKVHRKNCKAYSGRLKHDEYANKVEEPTLPAAKSPTLLPTTTTNMEIVVEFKNESPPPTSPNEPNEEDEEEAEPVGIENVDTTDEYPYAEQLEHLQDYFSDNNPLQANPQDISKVKEAAPSKVVRTKRLKSLQADKTRAEIDYFKQKTNYFVKELENLKVERSLMLLQAKKLRLEIERMEMDD